MPLPTGTGYSHQLMPQPITPGLWHVDEDGLNYAIVAPNKPVSFLTHEKPIIAICQLRSDAQLMAAAPILLQRLKMSLKDAEDAIESPSAAVHFNWVSIAEDIRYVIALAESHFPFNHHE